MKLKDKELLLKDLCTRLPYGVICKCHHTEFDEWDGKPFVAIYNETLRNIDANGVSLAGGFSYEIDDIKPYLRPLSSMTEEELDKYEELEWAGDFETLSLPLLDWLNANHFDYRGLIPMGMAIEVTKENNPYEK